MSIKHQKNDGGLIHKTILRRVNRLVMLEVHPTFLDFLDLKAGDRVNVILQGKQLLVTPRRRGPSYTLDELIAECDETFILNENDRECLDDGPVGKERL